MHAVQIHVFLRREEKGDMNFVPCTATLYTKSCLTWSDPWNTGSRSVAQHDGREGKGHHDV